MFFEPPPPSPEFHSTGLDAGRYVLVARVQGYAPGFSRALTLARGELLADVVIELVRPAGVVIRETPTNSIAFRADSRRGAELLERIDRDFTGWWQSADPKARDLKKA